MCFLSIFEKQQSRFRKVLIRFCFFSFLWKPKDSNVASRKSLVHDCCRYDSVINMNGSLAIVALVTGRIAQKRQLPRGIGKLGNAPRTPRHSQMDPFESEPCKCESQKRQRRSANGARRRYAPFLYYVARKFSQISSDGICREQIVSRN